MSFRLFPKFRAPHPRFRGPAAVGTVLAVVAATIGAATLPTVLAHADPAATVAPVVSYNFDNDSGSTVTDSSGSALNGKWVGDPAYGTGVSGQAAHISNGHNVTLPMVGGKTDASGSFSLEFWIKLNSFASGEALFANQSAASCSGSGFASVLYTVSANNNALVGCYGAEGTTTVLGAAPSTGSWHQVAAVVDRSANTATWYIDGQQSGATATVPADEDLSSDLPFALGQNGGLNYPVPTDALYDDVDFYDQPISADQIKSDYVATLPATPDVAPTVSYTFDNDSGTTATDASGNGNNGTWVGDPVYDTGLSGKAAHISKGHNVKLPLIAGKTDASSSFSFEFWIKATSYTGDPWLFANTHGGSCTDNALGIFFATNSNGVLTGCFSTSGIHVAVGNPPLVGAWHQVAGVVDRAAGTVTWYVDGAQSGPVTALASSLSLNSGLPFVIGQSGALNYDPQVDALYDDVDFYDQAISAGQIKSDFIKTGPQSVTVTTDGHGTASAAPNPAQAGGTVTLTQKAGTGYHFAGWTVTSPTTGAPTIAADGTFTMPDGAVAVRADFAPNTYTVHYDANGGTGQVDDSLLTYDKAASLPTSTFTRAGYSFAGWATDAAAAPTYTDGQQVTDLTATDGGTVTLYATWLPTNAHRVTVSSAGHGTAGLSGGGWYATVGSKVSLTVQPDTGYHLGSWQVKVPTDGSVKVASGNTFTMPAKDVAVQAQFAANTYTVRYVGNGADNGSMANGSFTYDQAAPLAPNGFARDGYRLAGWSTTSNGAVAYTDMQSVQNLTATDGATVTLYAQWSKLTVRPGAWKSLPGGFVTDTFELPTATATSAISQPLVGLWNGTAPTTYTKISGDSWLDVGADGTITGHAPKQKPSQDGTIEVSATNGTTTSQILVEVPVESFKASPQVRTASWNAWSDGSHVTDAVGKNLAEVAARGLGVIGFTDGGYAMANDVAAALGWQAHGNGDIGIVSAYPFTRDAKVFPTTSTPAAKATITVGGDPITVWDTHLDEAGYAPYNACFNGVTSPAALAAAERNTTRYAQAKAVVKAMTSDLRSRTPVLLLGDLASPSSSDWTSRTAAAHCGVGSVNWPVTALFTQAGLTDSYRAANPNPLTAPGITWSPVVTTNANGKPEPKDRVDYVDYTRTSDLTLVSSDTMVTGWPSVGDPAGHSWASDHAAVVSTFEVH